MTLRVPTRHLDALTALSQLPAEDADRLVNAIEHASFTLMLDDLSARVRDAVHTTADLDAIMRMLTSVARVREEEYKKPLESFISEVLKAWETAAGDEAKLATSVKERFKALLIRLLSSESITITSKALSVMHESAHVYCTSRVITDLRPVFRTDVREGPAAAVIVHTLRIRYHEGDDLQDFFVALDARDVRDLRDVLDRAINKIDGIEKIAQASKLSTLEIEVSE